MQLKPFTFLASPYSHSDPTYREERYRAAICGIAYVKSWLNEAVYCPIVHWHQAAVEFDLGTSHLTWHQQNLPFLLACDKLTTLELPGWLDSQGVTEEIFAARLLGKKLSHISLHELNSWLNRQGYSPIGGSD